MGRVKRRDIARYCLECCGGNREEVKLCHLKDCPLWPYRLCHSPDKDSGIVAGSVSLQVVKRKCLECSAGSRKESLACRCTNCVLWPLLPRRTDG